MANEQLKRTAAAGGVTGAGADQRAKLEEQLASSNPKEKLKGVKDKLAQNRQTQLQKAMELLLTGTSDEHSAIHHTLKDVMGKIKGDVKEEESGGNDGGDIHDELQKLVEKYKGSKKSPGGQSTTGPTPTRGHLEHMPELSSPPKQAPSWDDFQSMDLNNTPRPMSNGINSPTPMNF